MSRFTIMTLLFMRPKGLTPSELAEHMNVSQATTSGLLHNLEKEEIIERMSHAKDGRSYLICLSKKGKELADIIFPLYHGRLNEFWRDFSEEEKNHTFSCIEKLLDRVSDLSRPVVKNKADVFLSASLFIHSLIIIFLLSQHTGHQTIQSRP